MGTALDTRPAPAETAERGRGGFLRHPMNDAPWITDPDGTLVKSGKRKGRPLRVMYGSPSGYHHQIENMYNLAKWGERMALLGTASDPVLADEVRELRGSDPESQQFKTAADQLVHKAKDIAKANLAAERGTFVHAITEDRDEDRDWIERARAGEVLGLEVSLQGAFVRAWERMLDELGLEVLVVEASCVCDAHRVAGTLDRIVRATRDVVIGGRTITAGTVFVLDIKTGRLREKANGDPDWKYWVGYAIQVYTYADSLPYDTEAETRGEWPWPVSTEVAMIAHLDVRHALETGEALCRPIVVDLAAGRFGAELCRQAKAYERMGDEIFTVGGDVPVMSVPDVIADQAAKRAATTEHRDPVFDAPADPFEGLAEAAECEPVTRTSRGTPHVESYGETDARVRAAQPATIDPLAARGTPDEGEPVDDETFAALEARYLALGEPDRFAWLGALSKGAREAGVSFHGAEAHTVRRFEILRGLVALAHHGDCDHELVRVLVATAVGEDWPEMPAFAPGAVVGALTADEAAHFALLVDAWCADGLVASVGDDGSTRLVPA
jgi:hypothetical protein